MVNFSDKCVQLEKIILSETNYTQRSKCHMWFFSSEASISKSSDVNAYHGITEETKEIKDTSDLIRKWKNKVRP